MRIQVVHKNNEGPLIARLTGAKRAQGKYIAFVDSDDWVKEEMYSDLLHVLEASRAEVVSGLYRYWSGAV